MITELREIMRETGLARTAAIGQLVLDRFFGGSTELWRDRRRNKNNSIRRLADRPDCPLSRSALNQAIGVFAAIRNLPHVAEFRNVGASHIALVLPVPDEERERWLTRANTEHWSVRRLADEMRAERRAGGERRGRPPLALVPRALVRVQTALESLEKAVADLVEAGSEVSAEIERSGVLERLLRVEGQLVSGARGPNLSRVVPRGDLDASTEGRSLAL